MTVSVELVQVLVELLDTRTDDVVQSSAIDTWQKLLTEFSKLIGESDACLLLGRTVHTNSTEFPWLPQLQATRSGDELVGTLNEAMSERPRTDVIRVTRILLGMYIDLMIMLIGKTLSEQVIYRIASGRYP